MKKHKKIILSLIFILTLSILTTTNTLNASSLTPNQIQSIITLLKSFGADNSTVKKVEQALKGNYTNTTNIIPNNDNSKQCPNFSRSLYIGKKGEDVKELQKFLKTLGYFNYPEYTNYFGKATRSALRQFQCKHMNICQGTEATTGYGVLGSLTRSKILQICQISPSNTSGQLYQDNASNNTLYHSLTLGSKGEDVKLLQTLLKKKGYYNYPEITSFYGYVTQQAVRLFQCKEMKICSGSPELNGYGVVGPKTLAKLNSIFTKTTDNVDKIAQSTLNNNISKQQEKGSPANHKSCTLDGVTIAHNDSHTFYNTTQTTYPDTCSSHGQSRTCTDGTLSGDSQYAHSSCDIVYPGNITDFQPESHSIDKKTGFIMGNLADIDVLKLSDNDIYITGSSHTTDGLKVIRIYHTTDLQYFDLVGIFDPSAATTTSEFCHVWAPDLSYRNGKFVLTFSAYKYQPGGACVQWTPADAHLINENITLYQVSGDSINKLHSLRGIHYGQVISAHNENYTTPKIDPDYYQNRLYYVHFGNGNNIASVRVDGANDIVEHTTGSNWYQNGVPEFINEAPQVFTRNAKKYLQFSVFKWAPYYTVRYIISNSIDDLVRTANNTFTFVEPIETQGCQLTQELLDNGDVCVREVTGHGAIFSVGGQYYFAHHKNLAQPQNTSRSAYIVPIYFKEDGKIVHMTRTLLRWNNLGQNYTYSLDVKPVSGDWIGPCINSNMIGNSTEVLYKGLCDSANNMIVRKKEVEKFRLCYSDNGEWTSEHVDCKTITNDITTDELNFDLSPIVN